jgi:hypothetical protein
MPQAKSIVGATGSRRSAEIHINALPPQYRPYHGAFFGVIDCSPVRIGGGDMRGLGNGSFDPTTLASLETAFDETWLTLKFNGNDKVRPAELARCILRLATEGETDPERLQDLSLSALAPATTWRQPEPATS